MRVPLTVPEVVHETTTTYYAPATLAPPSTPPTIKVDKPHEEPTPAKWQNGEPSDSDPMERPSLDKAEVNSPSGEPTPAKDGDPSA
jgi:hypothetical protein